MSFFDSILDATIYFSFDRSGYKRHAKKFSPEPLEGKGKRVLITGGTSGIGLAAAKLFLERGCAIILLGRDEDKGKKVLSQLLKENPASEIEFISLDLSEKKDIKAFPLDRIKNIDILINNAGAMPTSLTKNSDGEEITWQTQVVGHYLLTELLISSKKLVEKGRVITVSSGGAYLQKLCLSDLNYHKKSYQKHACYANAKRAQIVVTEEWQKKYQDRFLFSVMHPGWVDTPGVKHSMPLFYKWTKKRLRSPKEGADTIIWLALTEKDYEGGLFWFDRKKVPRHFFRFTKENEKSKNELLSLLEKEKKK